MQPTKTYVLSETIDTDGEINIVFTNGWSIAWQSIETPDYTRWYWCANTDTGCFHDEVSSEAEAVALVIRATCEIPSDEDGAPYTLRHHKLIGHGGDDY